LIKFINIWSRWQG
jgi:hypothetical protein